MNYYFVLRLGWGYVLTCCLFFDLFVSVMYPTLLLFQSLHLVIANDVKQQVVLTGNNEIDKKVGKS